jgi:dephospho-CoA kinase
MFIIGLTGNIATGKSTVAALLRELGAEVIDADALVHELYQPGTEVTRRVAETFGAGALRPDGGVDRQKLGAMVWNDAAKLKALESIVHPAVAALRETKIRQATRPVVVLEAVKLFESGQHKICHQLWVVTASASVQLQRLMQQRGLSEEQARARLNAQPPLDEKLKIADVVIDNSGTLDDLRRKVEAAWRRIPSEVQQPCA